MKQFKDQFHSFEAKSNRKKTPSYPVKEVLNTTSPNGVPEAPNDFAFQTEPSSRTSRASATFHGISARPKLIATKRKNRR